MYRINQSLENAIVTAPFYVLHARDTRKEEGREEEGCATEVSRKLVKTAEARNEARYERQRRSKDDRYRSSHRGKMVEKYAVEGRRKEGRGERKAGREVERRGRDRWRRG